MKKIKNIIFDLGGVLLTIDYFKTEKAFIDLGVHNFAELYSQQKAAPLFENLETGKIENLTFYNQLREAANLTLSNEQIEKAWCAMLLHFEPKILEWLQDIGTRYNIYLFSNTNRIHHQAFYKLYHQQTGNDNFDRFFIKAWYSHDLGMRKPYPEAYTKLLDLEQLKADETLFIDDSEVNIIGAEKAGLQTIWLQHPQIVLDLIL